MGRESLIWHTDKWWTVLYVEYKEPTYIPNHLVVYQAVIQNVPEQNICEICDMKYYIASSTLALLYWNMPLYACDI